MAKALAIVGGGPKAAAIVARAATLRKLIGVRHVPKIIVFENKAVGSAWSGDGGFSNGHMTLCSPAEKDVGFPYSEYNPGLAREPVAQAIQARFSWSAFLVATGGYSEWIDRGRDYPSHKHWAKYLRWVFNEAKQTTVPAEVVAITRRKDDRWDVDFQDGSGTYTQVYDGVVLTGTGKARSIGVDATAQNSGRVFDAETFWGNRDSILKFGEIAVAGAGGAAGAIIAWLCRALDERSGTTIRSISPLGTLFPRGDGYSERRWFSDPSDWPELPLVDRKKIVDHTEAGVISRRNKQTIDAARNIDFVRGKARPVSWDGSELAITISASGANPAASSLTSTLKADCLINAVGFDPWSLLGIVQGPIAPGFLHPSAKLLRNQAEEEMEPDLSFSPNTGLGAGLHVPSLAVVARGPGMGTLGCLGLMAQSVLDGYLI